MNDKRGRASILVVDDTPANLSILTQMLSDEGYRPRPVPSGALGIRAAEHERPDLILMDINMPEMNGFETCRRIKEVERLASVPIIFISARTETVDKVAAFGAGGVDYITKPFDIDEVTARVATHLTISRLQSELVSQNVELERSYESLRNTERTRDALVHMVVHDMRSPLMVIQMTLQLLIDENKQLLGAASQQDISDGLLSSDALMHMVDDLLDISRFESEAMKLSLDTCDLVETVNEAVAGFSARVAESRISVDVEGKLVCIASFDTGIIGRVITNLVGNALKYSPEREPVRVKIDRSADAVTVSVIDRGPGIPPVFRSSIFDKFTQIEGRGSGVPSTGLGLAFCRLAVEAHGGDIGVDSEPAGGSCFWFRIAVPEQSNEE